MIVILFKLIVITSILVLAWTIVTQQGMALYSIREWANIKHEKGGKWVEPVLVCHWCMPSVWSLLGFSIAFGLGILNFEWRLILLYPLTVGGSSLTCGLIWGLHRLIEERTSYYINASKLSYLNIKKLKDAYKQKQNIEQKR